MQSLALEWRKRGIAVGFVPTMGYLHEGHLSLVKRARSCVGKHGIVVVSIYVNPTQFGIHEDLSRYPRDLKRDKQLCKRAGVDLLFVPSDSEMYPGDGGAASYSTYVLEESLSKRMEGQARPTHFRGVTTIVAKLLNIVLPEVSVFGAKDYQQAMIVRRMVRDLNFPVRIVVERTKREEDGLAMSSRNQYLNLEERKQAVVLWQALGRARQLIRSSGTRGLDADPLRRELKTFIEKQPAARVDYIEFFDAETLEPAAQVKRGTQMALAVFMGKTRLIDNARL